MSRPQIPPGGSEAGRAVFFSNSASALMIWAGASDAMRNAIWWVVAGGAGALAAVIVLTGMSMMRPTSHGGTWFTGFGWEPEKSLAQAANFSFPDQNRKPVSLAQFRGKVVILSFTSSVCRQQCPLLGRSVSLAEKDLGKLARDTVLLNISVDPEGDTKKTVDKFAREMGWEKYRWYYVWAPRSKMRPIWHDYYVYVPNPPPIFKPGASVVHTAEVVLVDKSGRVRSDLEWPFLSKDLAKGIRALVTGAQ